MTDNETALVSAIKGLIEGECQESPNAVHSSKFFCKTCGANRAESVHGSPNCPVARAELAIAQTTGGDADSVRRSIFDEFLARRLAEFRAAHA